MTTTVTRGVDQEMCAPTEGPIWAYYGRRAVDRKSTKNEPLHAVSLWARLAARHEPLADDVDPYGGARGLVLVEAECGVACAIEVGPWESAPVKVCAKCAKFVAGTMPMPADPPTPVTELVVAERPTDAVALAAAA